MSRRRRVFHLVAGTFAMIDILRRSWNMITDGARPIDWLVVIVDFLVLLAILIFEIREIRRERRHDREQRDRRRLVDERVAALRDAMSKGQSLRLCIPGSGDPRVAEWAQAVNKWGEETRVLLKSFSAHAETAFLLPMSVSPYITGSEGAVFEYISLMSRLDNLKGIIEKPDMYF